MSAKSMSLLWMNTGREVGGTRPIMGSGREHFPSPALVKARSALRILVPVSEESCSARAIYLATSLAQNLETEILLLHVIEVPMTLPLNAVMPEEEARAKNILVHATSLPGLGEVAIEGVIRRGRMACDEIVHIAKDWQADVIVMSAHSKRTLHQKIFGRTADRVRRKAPCELVLDEIPSYSA